jgi:hypothetical protein
MPPTNLAPTVSADMGIAGLNEIGFQTNIAVITGGFTDPSGPGPFRASVRWNSNGAFTPLILNSNSEFAAGYIYSTNGTRIVTVKVLDPIVQPPDGQVTLARDVVCNSIQLRLWLEQRRGRRSARISRAAKRSESSSSKSRISSRSTVTTR